MRPGLASHISSSRRPVVVALAVSLAVSLAIAASADAKIRLGRSIDGVSLGMTHTQVANILGPGKQEPGDSLQFDYRHDSYQVGFENGHVSSVETFDRDQRTSLGLGPGTSLKSLRARQPGVHCVYDSMDGSRDCYVGSMKRGHRFTDFFFSSGTHVTAVVVGAGFL